MNNNPIDEEVTALKQSIAEWMMRSGRKRSKLKKVERDDKSDLDWDSYL